MNDFVSAFNGLQFKKSAAITAPSEAAEFRKNVLTTEGSRLFSPVKPDQPAPAESRGATFGMPQGGQIEFAADREKREKAAANMAKARAARASNATKPPAENVVE